MRLSDFTYFVLCDVFKYICNLDSDTMPPRKKLKTITRAAQEADEQAAQETQTEIMLSINALSSAMRNTG